MEATEVLKMMRLAVPVPKVRVSLVLLHDDGPLELWWHASVAGIDWMHRSTLAFINLVPSQIEFCCQDAWRSFGETVERHRALGVDCSMFDTWLKRRRRKNECDRRN